MQFKGTGKENFTLVPLCWGSLFCVLLWWSTHHKKNVTTTIIKFTFMEYVLCDSALCNVLYNPLLNARRQMWLCPFYFFFFFNFRGGGPHCAAWGILFPWVGIEPMPLAVEAQSPNHWTTREFPWLCSFYLRKLNQWPVEKNLPEVSKTVEGAAQI